MKSENRVKGRQGEQLATEYLEKNGYRIVEKNYRNCFGEIDIIAKECGTLVFIEVKMRNLISYGHPVLAVDIWKQTKISKTAAGYIADKRYDNVPCRFDVVSIYKGNIEVFKDAFELTENLSW